MGCDIINVIVFVYVDMLFTITSNRRKKSSAIVCSKIQKQQIDSKNEKVKENERRGKLSSMSDKSKDIVEVYDERIKLTNSFWIDLWIPVVLHN